MHTRSAVAEQSCDWNLPAGQAVQSAQWLSRVPEQTASMYFPAAQAVVQGEHTASPSSVHGVEAYLPEEQLLHLVHTASTEPSQPPDR